MKTNLTVNGQQVEIDALRVTEGTTPSGSEWSRNPIPTCWGSGAEVTPCRPAFQPPAGCNETCWGYQVNGTYSKGSPTVEMPAIVDRVLIPKDLPAGNYVVGWRWVETSCQPFALRQWLTCLSDVCEQVGL